MNRAVKWIGAILAGLLGVVLLATLFGYFSSEQRIARAYDVPPASLALPADAASIEEGRRLVAIRGCSDCHEGDLGGAQFIDDPALGTIYAPNLTPGQGSAVVGYTPGDWERAIRHGIGPDDRSLYVMPVGDYNGISDEDLAQMIAYLQTLPPVDRKPVEHRLGAMGRALFVGGMLPLLSAETVDQSIEAPKSVTPDISTAYGQYIAATCTGCHGRDLAGGPLPGAGPDDIPAANLTRAGNLASWTYEDFLKVMQTGVTPEGKVLDPAVMPWPMTLEMTPVELEALWLYLSSLEPIATAN
jgi:mono/diheme cytochrome c family protein